MAINFNRPFGSNTANAAGTLNAAPATPAKPKATIWLNAGYTTTVVVDGVPFSYNANAGVWQGQSSNAKVNMDTFVKRVQQAKSITLK